MKVPDTIQPALVLVLRVLGIFFVATGVISLALHNLNRGLRHDMRQMEMRLRTDVRNDILRMEMKPRRRSPIRRVRSKRQ